MIFQGRTLHYLFGLGMKMQWDIFKINWANFMDNPKDSYLSKLWPMTMKWPIIELDIFLVVPELN